MGLLIKDILKIGETRLEHAGIHDFKVDAEELFCYLYNMERSKLFMNWSKDIDDNGCEQYFSLLDTRCSGVPLQYITGHQEFMGLDFEVNESVLIPRQDTEVLVEEALNVIKDRGRKIKKVLDLCTGSGAVGISIAKLSGADVTASDISEEAVATAKRNAGKNDAKVTFVVGDLFAPFKKKFGKVKFDMIVSNPPYIPTDVIDGLQAEVKDHEPRLALDGGSDGLRFYRQILHEAPDFLRKEGLMLLEIGCEQAAAVASLAEAEKRYGGISIIRDFAGLDRVAVLTLL